MLRTHARQGVVGGTALLVGLAGLTIGQGSAQASLPLPPNQAGPVAVWGPGDPGDEYPVPAPTPDQTSQAFTKVVANLATSAIGLTADGRVELLGTNIFAEAGYASDAIPTDQLAGKKVVDIAGDGNYGNGMAITDTGDVYTWNLGFEGWAGAMPSEEELHGATAGAISGGADLAAVVKQDGSVLVWGDTTNPGDFGQLTPPAFTDATAVFLPSAGQDVYALKSDGTLAAWGRSDGGRLDLPPVTTDATDDVDVVDVASNGTSAVALLSDGSLATWGPEAQPPTATDGRDIVALTSNGSIYFAVDSTGEVHQWGIGTADPAMTDLPDGVDPANITGLSANGDYYAIAIQATFGYVTRPTIAPAGTPKVGQTLTATPATFTQTPDAEAAGQWYRGDGDSAEAISGATATTYQPTTADVGKVLTYRSTATRGEQTATAASDPTSAVTAATSGGDQPGDNGAQQQKIAQAQQAYTAATATAGAAQSALATASAPKPVRAYVKALAKVTKAQAKVKAAQAKVAKAAGKAAKKKAKKALTTAKKALTKAKKALKKPKKKAGAAGKKYDSALTAYNNAVAAQAAAAQALANAQAGR